MRIDRWALLRDDDSLAGLISPDRLKILELALMAPSAHNMQPWTVNILDSNRWIIGTDRRRWLPAVDPTNRETYITLGAFAESLVQSSMVYGFCSEIFVVAKDAFDEQVMEVNLNKTNRVSELESIIRSRRTIRLGFRNKTLQLNDINFLLEGKDQNAFYFPMGSAEAAILSEATTESFAQQIWRDDAQLEFVNCLRLKKEEIRKYRNGFTAFDLPINSFIRWYVIHFLQANDLMKQFYRKQSVCAYSQLARQGAGWIVLATSTNDHSAFIHTGRLLMDIALRARERNIAVHPMSQIIAENNWQSNLFGSDKNGLFPQAILRVGYVNGYSEPVSLRMPPSWWVKI